MDTLLAYSVYRPPRIDYCAIKGIRYGREISATLRDSMSELRQDPTTKEWVIIASERLEPYL